MTNKQPWPYNKQARIDRLTKRLNQADHYLDTIAETHQDPDTKARFDVTAAKYELDCIRKIAEELGEIPRSTTETTEQEPLEILIHGIDTDLL